MAKVKVTGSSLSFLYVFACGGLWIALQYFMLVYSDSFIQMAVILYFNQSCQTSPQNHPAHSPPPVLLSDYFIVRKWSEEQGEVEISDIRSELSLWTYLKHLI